MSDDPNAWRLATVRGVIRETARAVTLQFEVPDWPGHLAGQRIDVRLTAQDGYSATRAYSMASPPGTSTVDVTVEELADGEVSPYLAQEVRPGDELEIRGPIGGAFTWRPEHGGPILLIAGGSGLVPLMAMVRAHAAARDPSDVRVLLSVQSLADVLYRDELAALAAAGTIALHETLTRCAPDGWAGSSRRIDIDMLARLGPAPVVSPTIFVCGPNSFVESAVALLLTIGHDPALIRTERFGPSAS